METLEEIWKENRENCQCYDNELNDNYCNIITSCKFKNCPFIYWIQKTITTTN